MSTRLTLILIALCGILGTLLLGLYFGVGFSKRDVFASQWGVSIIFRA